MLAYFAYKQEIRHNPPKIRSRLLSDIRAIGADLDGDLINEPSLINDVTGI